MNAFLSYAIESLLITGTLYLLYLILLRNRPLLVFNRLVLLLILIFGAVIPLVDFQIGNTTLLPSGTVMVQGMIEGVDIHASSSKFFMNWKLPYLGVSLILLCIFIVQLYQLLRLYHNSQVSKNHAKNIRLFEGRFPHFSFLNTIFLNKKVINKDQELDYVIAHEQVHVNQWHSLDIIFIELMKVILWFNPFIWLIKPCMVENHEYLADKHALKKGPQRSFEYLNQLINSTLFSYNIALVNNFNHSLIKKRIAMMTKKKFRKIESFIPLLLIPFMIGIVMFFACSEESTENMTDTNNGKTEFIEVPEERGDTVVTIVKEGQTAPKGIAIIGEFESGGKAGLEDSQVFFEVEDMPTFQGGEPENFRTYIMKNVMYPQEAKEKKEQGKVFVQFVVDAKGNVTNVKVVRGVSSSLDNEAIRVVKSSPKWEPGKQHSENVAVMFTFPITFSLQ